LRDTKRLTKVSRNTASLPELFLPVLWRVIALESANLMASWPGPYAVEFKYSVLTREHSHEVNCVAVGNPPPGTAIGSISLATRSNGTVLLQTAVQNYWNWYRGGHATSCSLLSWTLWKYTVGTLEKTFVNAGSVTNPTGATGTPIPAQQVVLSFRTAGGGIMNIEYMEGYDNRTSSTPFVANATGTYFEKVGAYVLSSEGWLFGRDDTWPIATLKISGGQNEALNRKITRPNA
jgi:hypothetical protein